MGRYGSLLPYVPFLLLAGWIGTRYRHVLGVLLIAHGLVHLLYVVPEPEQSGGTKWPFDIDTSWLLPNLGSSTVRSIGVGLMTVTVLGFAAAGIALLADQAWWMGTAVASVAASVVLLALYFDPMLALGLAIDAFVLSVVVLKWPVLNFAGA